MMSGVIPSQVNGMSFKTKHTSIDFYVPIDRLDQFKKICSCFFCFHIFKHHLQNKVIPSYLKLFMLTNISNLCISN